MAKLRRNNMKRKREHKSSGQRLKKFVKATGDYQAGKEMARTPKQELKAFDVVQASINLKTIAAPPVFTLLNACINGAELYQRVGRKIYMKSLHIRGVITNILTSTQDIGRILIIYDAQPSGVAPLIASVLQDSNAAAATTALSEISLLNRARYKILRDHQVILPSVSNAAGVLTNQAFQQTDNQLNIDMFIKLKGLETVYNGVNGGTILDIGTGAIYIIPIINGTTDAWTLTFTSRLRYYD